MSNTEVSRAEYYLATQMLNQVGETWEECKASAERVRQRLAGQGLSNSEIASRLFIEATRYEDM